MRDPGVEDLDSLGGSLKLFNPKDPDIYKRCSC